MLGNKPIISPPNSSGRYFRKSYIVRHLEKEKALWRLRCSKRSSTCNNNRPKRLQTSCNRWHWFKNISLLNKLKWEKTLKSLTNSKTNLTHRTQWPSNIGSIFRFPIFNKRITRLKNKSLEHFKAWKYNELFWSWRRYQLRRCM